MKIVVLDGYGLNPGDLSWNGLEALGELTVYDREIYKNYRFYPCNYVAYDLLNGTRRFQEHYGPKDKKQFEEYLQGQLDKIVLPNKDEAFLRKKILEMYSNPLKNYLTTL